MPPTGSLLRTLTTLICWPGEDLHFSFPSRIHCQRPVKTWKNLDRSLMSLSSWNEEACVHGGQGQVAACGLGSKSTGEGAHLSPGKTWVGGGNQTPTMAPGHSWRRCPGQVLGISGRGAREEEVTIWRTGEDRRGKAFSELGSRKRMQAGRSPSNQMPGLLSLLGKAGSLPQGSSVGWD